MSKYTLTIVFLLSKFEILRKLAKKGTSEIFWIHFGVLYTANVYRQTTDKLMFKSAISTQR